MPKAYLTLEEKRKAALEKEFRKQERQLRAVIQEKWRENGFKDREFKDRAQVSINTVTKFKKAPFTLECDKLIDCCVAAGIVLGVVNDE